MLNAMKALDINNIILLLILMMLFGQWSHRYYRKTTWGHKWQMQRIAPFIYYASGIVALALCILLATAIVVRVVTFVIGGN